MELQDKYPQWEALPQFAQFLLDHRDDLDDHQDELRHLAYWVVREKFDRQAVNRRLAAYDAKQTDPQTYDIIGVRKDELS